MASARIEDRWIGTGATGERFRDSQHPYADDLDVFGPGSLFQLVSGARTPMGEERLAAWLSSPASTSEIRERQSRIAGLRTRIDLRERIAVVNAGTRRRIEPARLIAWAETAPSLPSAAARRRDPRVGLRRRRDRRSAWWQRLADGRAPAG